MKKRLAILLLTVSCATAAKAQLLWSASGIVGRDGRPWNGEVSLYSSSSGSSSGERLRQTALATNGQVSGRTSGGGFEVATTPCTFFYRVVDGGKTFQSHPASQTTYFDPPDLQLMQRYPNVLELNFADMQDVPRFQGWLMTYGEWAEENGLGAWDARDAGGVANAFRFAFDEPEGGSGLGIRSLAFDAGGRPVVGTAGVVYTNGFTLAVQAADDTGWTENVTSHPLDESGGTVIDEDVAASRTRFYRIVATPTD